MSSIFQMNPSYRGLELLSSVRRKVFISYHHANDQHYYNEFSRFFSGSYDIFYDNSLDRRIDSTKSEYVNRKIREDYIVGSSATIVLCDSETFKRKWVDWEIHATLYHRHCLLEIILPTCQMKLLAFPRFINSSWALLFLNLQYPFLVPCFLGLHGAMIREVTKWLQFFMAKLNCRSSRHLL